MVDLDNRILVFRAEQGNIITHGIPPFSLSVTIILFS